MYLKKSKLPNIGSIPQFYQEVIMGYCNSQDPDTINTKNDLYNQVIWGNKYFCVDNKSLFSRGFIDAKIILVRDILLENGQINEMFSIYYTQNTITSG